MLFLKTIHSKEQILPHNILSTTGNIYTWTGKEFVEIILLVNEAFKLHSITGKGISPVCGSSLILELFLGAMFTIRRTPILLEQKDGSVNIQSL